MRMMVMLMNMEGEGEAEERIEEWHLPGNGYGVV